MFTTINDIRKMKFDRNDLRRIESHLLPVTGGLDNQIALVAVYECLSKAVAYRYALTVVLEILYQGTHQQDKSNRIQADFRECCISELKEYARLPPEVATALVQREKGAGLSKNDAVYNTLFTAYVTPPSLFINGTPDTNEPQYNEYVGYKTRFITTHALLDLISEPDYWVTVGHAIDAKICQMYERTMSKTGDEETLHIDECVKNVRSRECIAMELGSKLMFLLQYT